jgi:hypothetical protein
VLAEKGGVPAKFGTRRIPLFGMTLNIRESRKLFKKQVGEALKLLTIWSSRNPELLLM